MTRERRIIETLVELADTIVDDFDVVEFFHRLATRAVELLDCAEAGLLVADAGGTLRVMASSSEGSEALELLQSQNGEGPCWEAHYTGRQVFSEDLAGDGDRWPHFSPAALAHGFHAVQALPMRARGETIGALNLFRTSHGRLSDDDLPLAQGMADMAAISIMQERSLSEARSIVTQLESALRSRVIIEQAKGVVAERAATSVEEAFERLRRYARSANLRLGDVAQAVLDGRLAADALGAAQSESDGP